MEELGRRINVERSRMLPEFQAPPLNEVVCGIRFEALKGWQTSHYGLFWIRVKDEYPRCDDQVPLREILEPGKEVELEIGPVPPLRRVWLIHRSDNYVIQIQPTRFLHNWRRRRETDEYPRFGAAFDRFKGYLELFKSFTKEAEIGEVSPNQYELTYINHILEERGTFPRNLHKFIKFFSWEGERSLAEPSAVALDLRFPLPENRGTLAVSIRHGLRQLDQKEILVMELTARGPAQASEGDMDEWFRLSHESIVRGFADLTTPEAHRLWERTA